MDPSATSGAAVPATGGAAVPATSGAPAVNPRTGTATDALRRILASGPVRWLLAGDSITSGWGLRNPDQGYAGLFATYLAHEAGDLRAADVVDNSGVPGATVGETLWDFDERVLGYNAQVVSILLGMNDAGWGAGGLGQFADGMAELVDQVQALGAQVVLHTPYPVGPGDDSHDALPAYCDVIRELAARQWLPLVDHAAHWARLAPAEIAPWYLDPWHLRERGHAELARVMIDTLLPPRDGLG